MTTYGQSKTQSQFSGKSVPWVGSMNSEKPWLHHKKRAERWKDMFAILRREVGEEELEVLPGEGPPGVNIVLCVCIGHGDLYMFPTQLILQRLTRDGVCRSYTLYIKNL